MRPLLVGALFIILTPILAAVQRLLALLRLPGQFFISQNYYRLLCALLRVRVRTVGAPGRGRPLLLVANHVSWLDIVVLGALAPAVFIAKREVGGWPLIGFTARAQRTVFVDRSVRRATAATNAEIAERLRGGDPVVLFAEATSSDGNRVLAFRSGLLGALRTALAQTGARQDIFVQPQIFVQPVSVAYTRLQGLPMGRQHRPLVAWYGDLDFVPHLREFIGRGAVDAVVSFGEPVACDAGTDRKRLARQCEDTVRALTRQALRET